MFQAPLSDGGQVSLNPQDPASDRGAQAPLSAFTRVDESPIELFASRHIGPRDADIERMLSVVGYESLDDLTAQAVPESIRLLEGLDLPPAMSEAQVAALLTSLSKKNSPRRSMIGLGYYNTYTPPVIRRNVLENPAWYTAYTPYQPEISQGRLEALLAFQTMVCDLTGLHVAGASLLDEPTAAAEAMTLTRRASKSASNRFLIDDQSHPQTLAVLATRAEPLGIELVVAPFDQLLLEDDFFGVLLSYPSTLGVVRDFSALVEHAHAHDALVAVATDLLALALIVPPGEWGADIAVGSAQRLGVPVGFGGPHAAFMAVRSGLERLLPGRLVGLSVDADGDPAYRLALQTREQHIRREKATSNICTAQVLLAVTSAFYAAYHGPAGLRSIALHAHKCAAALAFVLDELDVRLVSSDFFDTVGVHLPGLAVEVVDAAALLGVNVRLVSPDVFSVSCDETSTVEDLFVVVSAVCESLGVDPVSMQTVAHVLSGMSSVIAPEFERSSSFLTHETFNSYHSETAMLRYLRKLADKDVALDRSMIPLGSCTMKLNATSEMEPITDPAWADIHPFAPIGQAAGYVEMIASLCSYLAQITGYDAVSLQPNAGSQGEFAGLLAIRAYHASRGESRRDVCLIPSSAHGTNAASAVMAGMRVVVVECLPSGEVDVEDLRSKVSQFASSLAALMVTYPSTFGVYEQTITQICALVHDAGGQVYVDGANLNALVGLAKPGKFGADVSHLNLHKTFCIPHGGGGPGVGPVAVRSHLAQFLPSHPLMSSLPLLPDLSLTSSVAERTDYSAAASPESISSSVVEADVSSGSSSSHLPVVGPVSGAPFGSAGILPIPFAYIRLMGPDGLRRASQVAVLSANYVAARLRSHYPIVFTGSSGLVAHECIIDLRDITKRSSVTVEDVAKRLIDYGFHAPTMSFPLAGTLMIEPTESEDLVELDRFVDALISIRSEIASVEQGVLAVEDSPLRHAPHTAKSLLVDWDGSYSPALAAYPSAASLSAKYWPPVRRIDGAFGDRNLVCSCPPVKEFAD